MKQFIQIMKVFKPLLRKVLIFNGFKANLNGWFGFWNEMDDGLDA
jgi:hypothetical protein